MRLVPTSGRAWLHLPAGSLRNGICVSSPSRLLALGGDKPERGSEASLSIGPLDFSIRVPIPADTIQVEHSETPRYLRLREGDIEIYSRVMLSVEGAWYELTHDRPHSRVMAWR